MRVPGNRCRVELLHEPIEDHLQVAPAHKRIHAEYVEKYDEPIDPNARPLDQLGNLTNQVMVYQIVGTALGDPLATPTMVVIQVAVAVGLGIQTLSWLLGRAPAAVAAVTAVTASGIWL